MEKIKIHKNKIGISFFSLHADEIEVGRMLVTVTPDILEAGYTNVDIAQRTHGYGKKLVEAVVDYARQNNLKVIAKCGFVAMIFNKYPETYADIRAEM